MNRTPEDDRIRRLFWLCLIPPYSALIFLIFYIITGHKL